MASYGRGSYDGFDSYQGGAGARDGGSDFTRLSNQISHNIQKITQNVTLVKNLVSQIGTPQDSEEVRTRVEQTIHYTNQLHKETSSQLKELSQLHLPPSSQEQRQWRMQKERYTEEFSNLLKNFQTVQREAVSKMRASVQRARALSGINQAPFHDDIEKPSEMAAPGYSQTREVLQMEQDVDLEMLQEREDAIRKLEKDISDVNTIFKDLGMLVHQQGEALDSIEANIDNAQMSVQEGTSQLSRAREYQSESQNEILEEKKEKSVTFSVVYTVHHSGGETSSHTVCADHKSPSLQESTEWHASSGSLSSLTAIFSSSSSSFPYLTHLTFLIQMFSTSNTKAFDSSSK